MVPDPSWKHGPEDEEEKEMDEDVIDMDDWFDEDAINEALTSWENAKEYSIWQP